MMYLTINKEGKMTASQSGVPLSEATVFSTIDELYSIMIVTGETDIICSSSLDFPNEHTDDQSVIDMADWIRNGEDIEKDELT